MEFPDLTKFTSLGRPVDPRYPTNLAILGLTAVVALGAGLLDLLSGGGLSQAFRYAFQVSAGFFIAWVVGREIDPDYEYAAFVGPALTLVGLAVGVRAEPGLLLLVWLIVSLRILNRSIGLPARIGDSLAASFLAGLLVFQDRWLVGLIMAMIFALDGWLSPPQRRQLWFGGLALLGTALWLALGPGPGSPDADPVTVGASLTITVLFTPVLLSSSAVRAVGDATGERLHARRVQATQGLALLTGILLVVWEGESAFTALSPAWAALLGASLYRALTRLTGE